MPPCLYGRMKGWRCLTAGSTFLRRLVYAREKLPEPFLGQCDRVNLPIGKASVSWIKLPGNEEERRRRRRGIKCCNSAATRWFNCPSIYSSNLIRWQSTSTRSLNAQCTKYDIMWSIFPCYRQPRWTFSSETWKKLYMLEIVVFKS